MRTLVVVAFILALFVGPGLAGGQAPHFVLGCLQLPALDAVQVTWRDARGVVQTGRWVTGYRDFRPLYVLHGEPGVWYGYGDGSETWAARFGWPDDTWAWAEMRLWAMGRVWGHVWFFASAQWPDTLAYVTFRTMTAGDDGGHHDFCGFGTLPRASVASWFDPYYRGR